MDAHAVHSIVRKTFLDFGEYQVVPHDDRRITYSAVSSGDHSFCMVLPSPCTNEWWLEPNSSGVPLQPAIGYMHVTVGPSVYLTFVVSGTSSILFLGHADGLAASDIAVEANGSAAASTATNLTEFVSGVVQKISVNPTTRTAVKLTYTGTDKLSIVAFALDKSGVLASSPPKSPVSASAKLPQSTPSSHPSEGSPQTSPPATATTPTGLPPSNGQSTGPKNTSTAASPRGGPSTAFSPSSAPITGSAEPTASLPGGPKITNPIKQASTHGLSKSRLAGIIIGVVCAVAVLLFAACYLRRRWIRANAARSRNVEPYALYPSGGGIGSPVAKNARAIDVKNGRDDGAAVESSDVQDGAPRSVARSEVPMQWTLVNFLRQRCRPSELKASTSGEEQPPQYAA